MCVRVYEVDFFLCQLYVQLGDVTMTIDNEEIWVNSPQSSLVAGPVCLVEKNQLKFSVAQINSTNFDLFDT